MPSVAASCAFVNGQLVGLMTETTTGGPPDEDRGKRGRLKGEETVGPPNGVGFRRST